MIQQRVQFEKDREAFLADDRRNDVVLVVCEQAAAMPAIEPLQRRHRNVSYALEKRVEIRADQVRRIGKRLELRRD